MFTCCCRGGCCARGGQGAFILLVGEEDLEVIVLLLAEATDVDVWAHLHHDRLTCNKTQTRSFIRKPGVKCLTTLLLAMTEILQIWSHRELIHHRFDLPSVYVAIFPARLAAHLAHRRAPQSLHDVHGVVITGPCRANTQISHYSNLRSPPLSER